MKHLRVSDWFATVPSYFIFWMHNFTHHPLTFIRSVRLRLHPPPPWWYACAPTELTFRVCGTSRLLHPFPIRAVLGSFRTYFSCLTHLRCPRLRLGNLSVGVSFQPLQHLASRTALERHKFVITACKVSWGVLPAPVYLAVL